MKHRHWSTISLIIFGLHSIGIAANDHSLDVAQNVHFASEIRSEISLESLRTRSSSRPDVGTKDAPVDGADGKPHAGPFVESAGDTSSAIKVSELISAGEKQVPENGVMNDRNRAAPKKGTTGTEGGVSEKDRQREAAEAGTGQRRLKKPEPPKEMHSNPITDRLDASSADEVAYRKTSSTKATEGLSRKTDKPRGAVGIDKPKDLEDSPHKIPHPEPPPRGLTAQQPGNEQEDNDSDNMSDEETYDIIPWDSLAGSFSSIAATEIGDKTFIVAALMAMRHPRLQVFTAAFSALFVMTILSGFAGHAIGALISKKWSALLAALLFLVFGAKSIKEGLDMSPDAGASDEIREVQAELEEKEADIARREDVRHRRTSSISPYALESGRMGKRNASRSPSASPRRPSASYALTGIKNLLGLVLSPAWVETFSMTFVGELGDRSQIATVAMAAGQEYFWIIVGATLGHFVCTAIAVIGGSVLAGRVSMRKVTLVGGGIFILFGILTLFEAVQQWR